MVKESEVFDKLFTRAQQYFPVFASQQQSAVAGVGAAAVDAAGPATSGMFSASLPSPEISIAPSPASLAVSANAAAISDQSSDAGIWL